MRGPRSFLAHVLVGLAPLAAVAGVLVLVEEKGPRGDAGLPPGSVYDEGPKGLSIAYRWAGEQARGSSGANVGVLTGRIGTLPVPSTGVILRIQPIRGPQLPRQEVEEKQAEEDEDAEKKGPETEKTRRAQELLEREKERERRRQMKLLTTDEEDFVRGGGRLVLGLDATYGPVEMTSRTTSAKARKVFPIWPGVVRLDSPGGGRGLEGLPIREARTLFVRGDETVVARMELGRGDVVLLSTPEVLSNASLAAADHLALLAALVGSGRSVLFDERAHGLGRDESLVSLLLEFGLGPSLLVVAFGLVLALWRGRVRVGDPEFDPADRRSEAVDLVESLGELYDRALSRKDAAGLYILALRREVALATGRKGEALDKRMRELMQGDLPDLDGRSEMPPADFRRILRDVNEGWRRLEEHGVSR